MNLEKIKELIQNERIKESVMKIIEFEQSQLHKSVPRYKERYHEIIKEAVDENYKNKANKL